MSILRVSSKSPVSSLAGAISAVVREEGSVQMQAIGAGSINQAIKAIAIARGFLAPRGTDLVCYPSFIEVKVEEETRTAIRIDVGTR